MHEPASFFAQRDTQAETIDTFSFTTIYTSMNPDRPDIRGGFTGVEEADGRIQLSDLTDFMVGVDLPPLLNNKWLLADLKFFQFNVTGGASSLNFAATNSLGYICGGFITSIGISVNGAPICGQAGAVGGVALVLSGQVAFVRTTTNFSTVTLESRTVTPPPAVPEGSSLALLAAGVVAIAFRCRRRLHGPHAARWSVDRAALQGPTLQERAESIESAQGYAV